MGFVLFVILTLAAILTGACFAIEGDNQHYVIWFSVVCWWGAFLYARSWVADVVMYRILMDPEVRFAVTRTRLDMLPKRIDMIYRMRYFHMWTTAQWKRWIAKRMPTTVVDSLGYVIEVPSEEK